MNDQKPNIYVLSDLHFDSKAWPSNVKQKLKQLNQQENLKNTNISQPFYSASQKETYLKKISKNPKYRYSDLQVKKNEESVINLLIKNNKDNNIFVMAGDFFNDLNATLNFIALLEKLKITSFVVLGNHDYWSYSETKLSLDESIKIAANETKDNHFCRLLMTGRIYRVGGLTFIGDSGFSNLKYNEFDYETLTTKELKQITSADDHNIKHFTAPKVTRLHEKWVKFAKKVINDSPDKGSLFVVTHWPMDKEANDNTSAWWQTDASFPLKRNNRQNIRKVISEKYWLISGHTHHSRHENNDISEQAGYQNEKWFKSLTLDKFGKLLPLETMFGLIKNENALTSYKDYSLVESQNSKNEINSIRRYGFRRAGNYYNKKVLSAYLHDSEDYIKTIKQKLRGIKNSAHGNAGYADFVAPQLYTAKLAIREALQVLEHGYDNNPFDFYTSLIITGYAYSGNSALLMYARKVNIYDIARQAMVYQTIMSVPEIQPSNIVSVGAWQGKYSSIDIANVELKIPVVNGYHLSQADFLTMAYVLNRQFLGSNVAEQKQLLLEAKIATKHKRTKTKMHKKRQY